MYFSTWCVDQAANICLMIQVMNIYGCYVERKESDSGVIKVISTCAPLGMPNVVPRTWIESHVTDQELTSVEPIHATDVNTINRTFSTLQLNMLIEIHIYHLTQLNGQYWCLLFYSSCIPQNSMARRIFVVIAIYLKLKHRVGLIHRTTHHTSRTHWGLIMMADILWTWSWWSLNTFSWKEIFLCFYSNVTEYCPIDNKSTLIYIVNGLGPKERQTIIWTNDYSFHWRPNASVCLNP